MTYNLISFWTLFDSSDDRRHSNRTLAFSLVSGMITGNLAQYLPGLFDIEISGFRMMHHDRIRALLGLKRKFVGQVHADPFSVQ